MLRSGLQVEEEAKLSLEALTRGRVLVHHGKGGKDRVVYISPDTHRALVEYLQLRPRAVVYAMFCKLVEAYRFFLFSRAAELSRGGSPAEAAVRPTSSLKSSKFKVNSWG